METIKYLLSNYWFENMDDFINTLENGERKDKENNLFFENAIDCIKELIEIYTKSQKQNDKINQNAYNLGALVSLWKVKDAQFTERAEKSKKEIEEKIGDIVEKYPELEELIPSPICWR